jgi:lysophospholipase L1-like esterase
MTTIRFRAAIAALALAAAAWLAPVAPAGHDGAWQKADTATYYVSVGDSLSAGTQPGRSFTDEGYADQLYITLGRQDKKLQLVKLGCPGETTTMMVTGVGSPCPHAYGSQLADALAFLRQHRERIRYVTIDIGANDVLPCAAVGFAPSCVGAALGAIQTNLPVIMAALKAAAETDVRFAGMNYWNPFVALYGSNQALALASTALTVNTFNPLLEGIYTAFGVPVADAETAFSVTNFAPVGGVPFNVTRVCAWTWMCAVGNIHPNATGYGVLAHAFEQALK